MYRRVDKVTLKIYNTDIMIPRFIEKQVLSSLKPGKVCAVFGPRRSGKTVFLEMIRDKLAAKKVLSVQGENLDVAEILSSMRHSTLAKFTKGYDYLFVDEAQKIPQIGQSLKLLVDTEKSLTVLVTGSSSFSLRQKVGDPLVGRISQYYLYPFAQMELKENFLEVKENLETRLVFGSYPEVFQAKTLSEKRRQLEAIRDGYLLRDILELDNIKDSLFVFNILRLIAFQIGNDISYSELAQNLNSNKKTVMRYLELLEKSYVLFSHPGFSRNLRSEYTKTPRYYFWDNGVRNAVISNYNRLESRDDVGRLWENYCICERRKKSAYKNIFANRYFWRTYNQKEIDYVEERGAKLFGYEFKWSQKEKVKTPKLWMQAYKNARFSLITPKNYLEFIT